MRKLLLTLLAGILLPAAVWADNTSESVSQVTTAVTLSTDVDYHITSATPFTATGSINITNTDHAVVIFDQLKPSEALAQLGFISINGAPAQRGTNCQVKMYGQGAMILPYDNDLKPLTVFSEENYQGESCNDFGLEDAGGFMNTLTEAKLNNRIKSFKLKRGYMVTFSTRSGGYGYSRCFIAANADLEMNLPKVLAGRVSSYRIFKWNDASKKGLANDNSTTVNNALNTTWSYNFSLGNDGGIDREVVPHHIYEDWPSVDACGAVTYSPHLKTNNEPGNSADDHPQSVATVLANWERLMATGMRLCTPSSHDGSLNWMREFVDSIDARGWRCDIVDVHSYWTEGSFNNLGSWYNNYGQRPLWITEWVWGASWNHNGVFTNGWEDSYRLSQNAVKVKQICETMNGMNFVERYAYWNSEQWYSRLYNDNALTETGRYYAAMDPGVGFNPNIQKIPTAPRMAGPVDLAMSFRPNTMQAKLTWKNTNGEFDDSMFVERQRNNDEWERISRVQILPDGGSYTFDDLLDGAGNYSYRIHTFCYNGVEKYSEVVYLPINGTEGTADLQYGTLTASSIDDSYNYFSEPFLEQPAIVFGGNTFRHNQFTLVEHVKNITKVGGNYAFFRFHYFPFTLPENNDYTFSGDEFSHYLVAKPGTGVIGNLNYEAGYVSGEDLAVGSDTVTYTFTQPFKEAPAVFVTPRTASVTYPCVARVLDVTPTSFRVVAMRQQGVADANQPRIRTAVSFFAIEKGEGKDENNKLFTVQDTMLTIGSLSRTYILNFGRALTKPLVYAMPQTLNRPLLSLIRFNPNGTSTDTGTGFTTDRIRLVIDATDTENGTVTTTNPWTERVAWMTISDDEVSTGIHDLRQTTDGSLVVMPRVVTDQMTIEDTGATTASIYNIGGACVETLRLQNGKATFHVGSLAAGVYVVTTNAGHRAKFVKK